jgi:hypothetical protein
MFDARIVRSALLAITLAASAATALADGNDGYGRSRAPAPVEGTWLVRLTPYVCATGTPAPFSFDSMLIFAAGGTLQETTSNPRFQPGQRGPGFGYWTRTGRTTYDGVFQAFILTTGGSYARGVQRVEGEFETQDDGSLTGIATVAFVDEAGAPLPANSGCVRLVGTRMP